MKRWSWGASALGTLSVAVAMAVAAQEPRQDQAQEPRTTDQPQMKGMMTRGMPVHGMMPMMMEMHRQHAAMESQWEATDAGIFVLRPGQLLRCDGDLKLVKTMDLPKMSPPMMPHHGDEADEVEGGPKMKMDRGGMQQMMARMHGGRQVVLPSELMSILMPSPESGLTFYAITTSVEGVPGEHDGQGQERREEDKHGFFACPRDKV